MDLGLFKVNFLLFFSGFFVVLIGIMVDWEVFINDGLLVMFFGLVGFRYPEWLEKAKK